jgi:hypothetical protein
VETRRGMSKPISVYAHDANVDIDPPLFHASVTEAQIRIDRDFAFYLSPTAVRLKPPAGWTVDERGTIAGGSFSDAWKPRISGYWVVWQMTTRPEPGQEATRVSVTLSL